MGEREFRLVVQGLLNRYDGTPLLDRWQEATSFGAGKEAADYWIRDTGGVTNIVWLNSDGVRDVTMIHDQEGDAAGNGDDDGVPESFPESMFNFLPLRNISTIEIRAGTDIARQMGLTVSGDKLVRIIPKSANAGQLYWVAGTPTESQDLDRFAKSVFSAYVYCT
jgi:hypothetical protein